MTAPPGDLQASADRVRAARYALGQWHVPSCASGMGACDCDVSLDHALLMWYQARQSYTEKEFRATYVGEPSDWPAPKGSPFKRTFKALKHALVTANRRKALLQMYYRSLATSVRRCFPSSVDLRGKHFPDYGPMIEIYVQSLKDRVHDLESELDFRRTTMEWK